MFASLCVPTFPVISLFNRFIVQDRLSVPGKELFILFDLAVYIVMDGGSTVVHVSTVVTIPHTFHPAPTGTSLLTGTPHLTVIQNICYSLKT